MAVRTCAELRTGVKYAEAIDRMFPDEFGEEACRSMASLILGKIPGGLWC